ncbi:MAG TPA: hypothetical protein VL860_05695 [Planctomycetota bacterium]|nr:hypothetical protein [Planctomycetota bacterium]
MQWKRMGLIGAAASMLMLAVTLRGLAAADGDPAGAADAGPGVAGGAKSAMTRWFFAFGQDLKKDEGLQEVKKLVDTAAAHGYNGMLFGNELDSIPSWDKAHLDRLDALKKYCDDKKIEIIPLVLSVGYGSGITELNMNLCEGLPIKDILFEVKGAKADIVPSHLLTPDEGGFEKHEGDNAAGIDSQDQPGVASFIDTTVAHSGKASLCFQNWDKATGHRIRIVKKLPGARKDYVLRFYAKSKGLKPAKFSICLYDGEQVSRMNFNIQDGADWQLFECTLPTMADDKCEVVIGSWDAKEGQMWIDDLDFFEPGLVNVLRRPGTPVVVKKDGTGEVFEEGKDFEKIRDPQLAPRHAWHTPPSIVLTANSRIKDGDKLRVSYYIPFASAMRTKQTVVCMSEPELYEKWAAVIKLVNEHLRPNYWQLDMDEIRGGGSCEACHARKNADGTPMNASQILGDCVGHAEKLIRAVNPKAEVCIWHDMFSPDLGAVKDYQFVEGGFDQSWKYLPADVIIVCWIQDTAEANFKFFTELKHRVIASISIDGDDPEGVARGWLAAFNKYKSNGVGATYVTWERKYEPLAKVGDIIAGK